MTHLSPLWLSGRLPLRPSHILTKIMAEHIPPPDLGDEGFAFTYTPDLPPLDIRELRFYVVKALMEKKEFTPNLTDNSGFSNENDIAVSEIIRIATRFETYINDGK